MERRAPCVTLYWPAVCSFTRAQRRSYSSRAPQYSSSSAIRREVQLRALQLHFVIQWSSSDVGAGCRVERAGELRDPSTPGVVRGDQIPVHRRGAGRRADISQYTGVERGGVVRDPSTPACSAVAW